MSHFTVLVITESPDDVDAALQPFHEYECTGVEDQYVIDVDVTDKVKSDYEEYAKKEEQDLKTFAEEWGNYIERDGKFFSHTNPNAKWDWWVIGGRWSGMMRTKSGAGIKGKPSLMGSEYNPRGVDQCQVGDLDWNQMKSVAIQKRLQWASDAASNAKMSFEDLQEALWKKEEVNKKWSALPDPKPRGVEYHDWLVKEGHEDLSQVLQANFDTPNLKSGQLIIEWAQDVSAFSTFAVLKDGKWYERGNMGWWGMVSDEKDEGVWEKEFAKLIESLSDDAWLTVVDCHI